VYTLFSDVIFTMAADRSIVGWGTDATAVSPLGAVTLEVDLSIYEHSRIDTVPLSSRVLYQEGRQLRLGDDRKLRVFAAYIAFPVWVLRWVRGCRNVQSTNRPKCTNN
jgi:hypothetical protein